MVKHWHLVTIGPDDTVAELLSICLARTTSLRAYFPDGPELGGGKSEFSALPQAAMRAWDGMANCVVVEAPLDSAARELVRKWMLPANKRKPLWQYELIEAGHPILRVEDFSVYMVYASREDLINLQERGIDTSLWEPISFQADEGAHPEPFSDEDLRQLADDLE